MLKRPMLLGAALAVLLSTPASAQVTLAELAPCYVSAQNDSQLVDVAAGGFTPFSKLDIFVNEVRVDTADADLNGNAFGRVKAPVVTSGQQVFKVRVAEEGRPENTIAKYSIVTAFSVQQSPKVARTSQRVTFRGRGFTGTGYVFAHYLFAGRPVKTVQIAYPEGPCGTFKVRRKQFPIKRPKRGAWTIQFDQVPQYEPGTMTKVTVPVTVRQTPKSRAR